MELNKYADNSEIYKQLIENIDFSNTDNVLLGIKEIINDNNLVTNQKLHAIGLILDNNKEK